MSIFLAMCLFSLSISISPGPVNMVILSSGVSNGFKRSMPFVTGAAVGFTLLLVAVGLGISKLSTEVPLIFEGLGYAGTAYMSYIGYKIITSRPELELKEDRRMRYWHGILMQWLNPKAWIACLSGVSAFGLSGSYSLLLAFVSIYFLICYLSLSAWALLGSRLQCLAKVNGGMKGINLAMGGSLILTALYLLLTSP